MVAVVTLRLAARMVVAHYAWRLNGPLETAPLDIRTSRLHLGLHPDTARSDGQLPDALLRDIGGWHCTEKIANLSMIKRKRKQRWLRSGR